MSDGMQLTRRKALSLEDVQAGKKIFGTKHSLSISEKAFMDLFKEITSIQPKQMCAMMAEVKRTMMAEVKIGATVHVPEWGTFRVTGRGTEVQDPADEATPITLQLSLLMDKSIKTAVAIQGGVPYSIVEQAQIIPVVTSVEDILSGTFNQLLTPNSQLDIRGTNLTFDNTKSEQGVYLIPTAAGGEVVKFGKGVKPKGTQVVLSVPTGLVSGTTYQIEIRTYPHGAKELRIGRYTPILTVA